MTETETAWLAGLLEGEGTIVFTSVNSIALTIFMTDEDVLRRCHEFTEAGMVTGPYQNKKRPTHKPLWKWSVTKGAHAEAILIAIYPWMGIRRQARIGAALERLAGSRGRERCQQGHNNWRLDRGGKRYCRDCASIAQRLRRVAAKRRYA